MRVLFDGNGATCPVLEVARGARCAAGESVHPAGPRGDARRSRGGWWDVVHRRLARGAAVVVAVGGGFARVVAAHWDARLLADGVLVVADPLRWVRSGPRFRVVRPNFGESRSGLGVD